ncbi:MAG: hypothetical protein OXG37_09065 [Actinomycetia bacterium]|nr:hypothetical protein [Actinomycetes bacterium]
MEANLAGIERVRELLDRLEQARARLEEVDGDEAVDVLRDLAELAKEVQAEIDRARRDEPESMPHAGG